MELIHQVDLYQGKEVMNIWLLSGINKTNGKALGKAGWQWIRGPQGGCWTTKNDRNQVSPFIDAGVKVIENVTKA